ncbi:MAG TPA: endopeptidase La [Vicinamibacteria bacterium]|nr:endopeptidase La [Vicinamibacteria bacterium]
MTERQELPVFPLKNSVLFPFLGMPLAAGRPVSIAAVESAVGTEEKELLVVAQRDAEVQEPSRRDLFEVGTKAVIRRLAPVPEGGLQLVVQGLDRVRIGELSQERPFLKGVYEPAPVSLDQNAEVEALEREVRELGAKVVALARPDAELNLQGLAGADGANPMRWVYILASLLGLEPSKSQKVLEADRLVDALGLMHEYLQHEVRVLEVRRDIASKVQNELTKQQREVLLRQQMRAIREELGESDREGAEAELFRERLEKADLPEDVRTEAERELTRLSRLPPVSPEFSVIRNYVELILELPWRQQTDAAIDLKVAREVLDEDHLGLEQVKERILEHLAVMKLNPQAKSPILSFVGPPGVGKTSLGKSIARALNRKFERMSLGGLHDEAELRGHRRTYIGAMPGRILQALRRAQVNNPVLMLDEIDKLGRDFRGDPASAMLEILDPQQNDTFRDNYLDLPFDLSNVFFITTANAIDTIPRPLLDRMEVLRLTGYSEEEKLGIAKKYLLPRQLQESGLQESQCSIPDEALLRVIRRYTREAGLRQLERTIGRLVRKVSVRFAEGSTEAVTIGPDDLVEMLGPEPFQMERARTVLPPGVATGLAWTETGGDVLYIETALLPGGSGLTLTGQLGEVMQESARAAQSFVWSHAEALGIDPEAFKNQGVHIHVPAGAIPKDGPSAGVTIATALASLYCGKPVRADTAMTGEVTIAGLVLPIGGIKEKVLAARRADISRIILPKQNESGLRDVPSDVRKETEFVLVERIEEALEAAIPHLSLVKAGSNIES